MKIGLYADPHVSQSSSIIVGKQGEFSGRLDNLIKSFEWMDKIFKDNECDVIVCLGDLTDKPQLSAEEITAMSLFKNLNNHILLIGNHCRSDKSGRINSVNMISKVIYSPTVEKYGDKSVLFLPYNSSVEDLSEYKNIDVILSHNDIVGYDYGNHISESGYDIQSILDNCKLFINGHLHNGGWLVKDRVINLGQLSGMNFSSCGGQWEPSVGILDLSSGTPSIEVIENPYAYRFKKESFTTLVRLKEYLNDLPEEGQYVLQVKVPAKIADTARTILDKSTKVIASRVLTVNNARLKSNSTSSDKSVIGIEPKNIYSQFKDFLSLQDSSKFNIDIANNIITELENEEGAI